MSSVFSKQLNQDLLTKLDDIKRWPGDGLELSQLGVDKEHFELSNPCEVQKKLTSLLGYWPTAERFADMNNENKQLYASLPYLTQAQAARKLADFTKAADHLFDVCEDPVPKLLLKEVDAYGAVKYGRRSFHSWQSGVKDFTMTDEMRLDENSHISVGPPEHHGINLILVKLVQYEKDTDANLQLLFGSELRVLGAMMDVREILRGDAPPGSPAATKQAQLLNDARLKPLLTCARCSILVSTDDKCGCQYLKCGGCHREVFCSKQCMEVEWVVHCIDCFRVQGKPIRASRRAKAEAELLKRQQVQDEKKNVENQEYHELVLQSIQHDLTQTRFSTHPPVYDCNGVPQRKDLSIYYLEVMKAIIARHNVGLVYVEDIMVIVNPVGVEGGRYVLFENPVRGAYVLLAYTCLFECFGDGPLNGIAIDAVYVVKTAVPVPKALLEKLKKENKVCGGKVEWMSVPSPTGSHITSGCTLLVSWLSEAKLRATVPTKDLFYHLGSKSGMKRSLGYVGP